MGRVANGWKLFCEFANGVDEAKKLMTGWDRAIQFSVTGEDVPEFYLQVKDGAISFNEGKHASPAFTMKGTEEIMWKLLAREEDPTKAYIAKKYTIEGSLAEAMKFGSIANAVAKAADAAGIKISEKLGEQQP